MLRRQESILTPKTLHKKRPRKQLSDNELTISEQVEGSSNTKNLKKLVKDAIVEESKRLSQKFKNDAATNGKVLFAKSCSTSKYLPDYAASLACYFNLDEDEYSTDQTIMLEKIDTLPPMRHWINTTANFTSEDEHTLSHIPYLGDDVFDESYYYGELMAAYPNGIHGEVRGSEELMNDYILYQLNKNIRAQFPHANQRMVARAISEQFPTKTSASELCAMLPRLQRRFEPNAEPEFHLNEEQTLRKTRDDFCFKCLTYCCVEHSATNAKNIDIGDDVVSDHAGEKITFSRRKIQQQHRRFRVYKWSNDNGELKKAMLKPCKHRGDCTKGNGCYCAKASNPCTKYCSCSISCHNRFPGCLCSRGSCSTNHCPCYKANWECEPDRCKSCFFDASNLNKGPICKNISLQMGREKDLFIAPSKIAGWGCFAAENIDKDEFIIEYVGEVISNDEMERRNIVYNRIHHSTLFTLNDDQTIDAFRFGNVARFINNSSRIPNCRALVMVVDGVHRVAIFASKPILANDELLYNYGYDDTQRMHFVPKEIKRHSNSNANPN